MKTAHHLLAVLIVALFVGSTATVQAQFNYEASNGTITITGYTGPGGAVIIPDIINGLPVISIADFAFHECSSLTCVTIGTNVTSIGFAGFAECTSLTNVTLGNGVTRIEGWAFLQCTSLVRVTIPDSVTTIGSGAFDLCTSLTSITVDTHNSAYRSVDGVLFDKNQTTLIAYPGGKAGSYIVPGSVTRVQEDAFWRCGGLTSVTIPDSVTTIGYGTFSACTSLTAITVGAANSFYSSVNGVLFDKNQTTLIQCPGGKSGSYMIPNSVTSIGFTGFAECTSLTSITIPDSVTTIGSSTFRSCTRLTNVTIGNSLISIPGGAFMSCTSLTSVIIPNSVTYIGGGLPPGGAFMGCTSLTNVTIGNSVTRIEIFAFFGCTSLINVTIPNSVTSIEDGAFSYCTNLTGVNFKGNAPSPASGVFDLDSNATVYYLPGTTGWGTTFAARPTAPWVLPHPVILKGATGVQANSFSFRISWATNRPVVVEATASLTSPTWSPVSTNTLVDGWTDFRDPQWTNYPSRFYRVRGQ